MRSIRWVLAIGLAACGGAPGLDEMLDHADELRRATAAHAETMDAATDADHLRRAEDDYALEAGAHCGHMEQMGGHMEQMGGHMGGGMCAGMAAMMHGCGAAVAEHHAAMHGAAGSEDAAAEESRHQRRMHELLDGLDSTTCGGEHPCPMCTGEEQP